MPFSKIKEQAPESLTRRLLLPFEKFARLEAKGGILLLIFTAAALAWANSPWSAGYFQLWQTKLPIGFGAFKLSKSLLHWINDGFMAVFFFVVGLEIKRELLQGELNSLQKAALPLAAAVGGMVAPAAIYIFLNAGGPGAAGWGIPMATDIAFALGVLALLGRRAPLALKVFLTALAIIDDIGAVLVIAFFYTANISWLSLLVGAGFLAAAILANRIGTKSAAIYIVLGIGLWVAFLKSGVHATIAGVLLAMTIPLRSAAAVEESHSLLQRMEEALHPWVTFFIIPLFALANAGVTLGGDFLSSFNHPITMGVALGLFFGKQIGVMSFSWLALRLRWASLPAGVSWLQVYGASLLAGIGFTMSLFIANLAFADEGALVLAKVGILSASAIAAVVGLLVLRLGTNE